MIAQDKKAPALKSVSHVRRAYILIEDMIITLALAPGRLRKQHGAAAEYRPHARARSIAAA